jgi:hypothetical protein
MLSSVNLPGGVQRRKLESDELQMRLCVVSLGRGILILC